MRSTSTHPLITLLFISILFAFIGASGCVESSDNTAPDHTTPPPSADNTSTYIITTDGVPLRYAIHDTTLNATHGQGKPPVIFVLGYGMTLDEWPGRMISHLAESRRVILYNHRGVSGIQNPDLPFTIRQGAIDLHDVILQLTGGDAGYGFPLGDEGDGYSAGDDANSCLAGNKEGYCTDLRIDIVGYSMGGMIALE